MSPFVRLAAALAALLAVTPAHAEGLGVHDAHVYAAMEGAASASAYMTIHNHGGAPDRLLGASSPAAASVTLHRSEETDGVMRMVEVTEGVDLPTDGAIEFAPGGLHIMLMGLTAPLAAGATIPLTLDFEVAGPMTLDLPVEIQGMEGMGGAAMDHADHATDGG